MGIRDLSPLSDLECALYSLSAAGFSSYCMTDPSLNLEFIGIFCDKPFEVFFLFNSSILLFRSPSTLEPDVIFL